MTGFFQELRRRKVYRVAAAHRHRRVADHSSGGDGFPGVGVARLEVPAGDCARAHGIPDCADFGLGVRCHARGNRANGERSKRNQNSVSAAEKCRFMIIAGLVIFTTASWIIRVRSLNLILHN
jgi:hypothetical protein